MKFILYFFKYDKTNCFSFLENMHEKILGFGHTQKDNIFFVFLEIGN
jgi:hypothetical protein